MPKVHKQTARKDIYQKGTRIETRANKRGYRIEKSIPNKEGDKLVIAKGEVYYKWSFRNGGTHISKTYPKRSQLTQSHYLGTLYDLEDTIAAAADSMIEEDVQNLIDETLQTLEELKEGCEDSLENIPEQLHEAPVGTLLQERIEAMEEAISEIESIDVESEGAEAALEQLQEISFE